MVDEQLYDCIRVGGTVWVSMWHDVVAFVLCSYDVYSNVFAEVAMVHSSDSVALRGSSARDLHKALVFLSSYILSGSTHHKMQASPYWELGYMGLKWD
jgi:hypothetical protein